MRHRHLPRMIKEQELTNYVLNQLLKTASSSDANPYNYHPRHHTKDPEYQWETEERRTFKRGFNAPDVSMLRPQGDDLPPHLGNYPLAAVGHRRIHN